MNTLTQIIKKRSNFQFLDYLSFGFPILPSSKREQPEPPEDKLYTKERELRRSKSQDVIEEKTSVSGRKSWLEELTKREDEEESTSHKNPARSKAIDIGNTEREGSLGNLSPVTKPSIDIKETNQKSGKGFNKGLNKLQMNDHHKPSQINRQMENQSHQQTTQSNMEENNNETTTPLLSVKDKLKLFQKQNSDSNQSQSNARMGTNSPSGSNLIKTEVQNKVIKSNDHANETERKISLLGSSMLATETDNIIFDKTENRSSSIDNPIIPTSTKSHNTENIATKTKLMVKDKRILQEIAEVELREKEYQNRKRMNSTNQSKSSRSTQAEGDSRNLPKGLQAFLLENELR